MLTKKTLLLLISVFITFSCKDEIVKTIDDDSGSVVSTRTTSSVTLKDGRLCFPDDESLKTIHQNLTSLDDDKIYNFVKPFYEGGFISLRPILLEELESDSEVAIQREQMNQRSVNITLSDLSLASRTMGVEDVNFNDKYEQIAELIDNTESIISDDVFAVLLNYLGEIQIGNKIYKYTDIGRFSTSESDKYKIDKFLESNNISGNPIIPTEYNNQRLMQSKLNPSSSDRVISTVDNGIEYFISSTIDEENQNIETRTDLSKNRSEAIKGSRGDALGNSQGGNRGGSQGGSRGNVSGTRGPRRTPTSVQEEVTKYLTTISDCNPKSGIFGNLFGTNKVCKNRYAAKRRVKVKAFCNNYGIAYSVGTKVKHQKKGRLGLWRTSKASYIEMGVEYAQFTYDYSKMVGATISNIQKAPKIYFNGHQYIDYMNVDMVGIKMNSFNVNNYPKLFRGDIIIERFGLGLPWWDERIKEGIKSANNALTSEKLNEYFWKVLWDSTNSFLSSHGSSNLTTNKNRTLLSKFPDEGKILVQKSHNTTGTNIGVRSYIMDWGVLLTIKADPDNNWSLDYSPSTIISGAGNLVKPKNFKCSMYGVVRGDDGKIHGVKMSF